MRGLSNQLLKINIFKYEPRLLFVSSATQYAFLLGSTNKPQCLRISYDRVSFRINLRLKTLFLFSAPYFSSAPVCVAKVIRSAIKIVRIDLKFIFWFRYNLTCAIPTNGLPEVGRKWCSKCTKFQARSINNIMARERRKIFGILQLFG